LLNQEEGEYYNVPIPEGDEEGNVELRQKFEVRIPTKPGQHPSFCNKASLQEGLDSCGLTVERQKVIFMLLLAFFI
jgi:hypothetical protein